MSTINNKASKSGLIFCIVMFLSAIGATSYAACGFSDVPSSHQYCDDIEFAKDINYKWIDGYHDGTFKPDIKIQRDEFIKIVVNAVTANKAEIDNNISCFTDVHEEDWFVKYVCYAKEKEIVKGYSDGSFKPSDKIKYIEALKITLRAMGYKPNEPSIWYLPYISAAKYYGFDLNNDKYDAEISRGFMVHLMTQVYVQKLKGELKEPDFIYSNGYEIRGDILVKYQQFCGKLGLPITKEYNAVQYQYQKFETGTIYKINDKIYAVYGDIWNYYSKVGGASNSYLGLPEGDRAGNDQTGYYQVFEGGKLYERTGQFVVPYVPMIREDKCGIVTHDGFIAKDWGNLKLFNHECGLICGTSTAIGCHITAVAMIDAYYSDKIDYYKDYQLDSYNKWLGQNNCGISLNDNGVLLDYNGCFIKWSCATKNISYIHESKIDSSYLWKNDVLVNAQGEKYSKILDEHSLLQDKLNKAMPVILQYEYIGSKNIPTKHAIVIVGKNYSGEYIVQDQFYAHGTMFITLDDAFWNNKTQRTTTDVNLLRLIFYGPK